MPHANGGLPYALRGPNRGCPFHPKADARGISTNDRDADEAALYRGGLDNRAAGKVAIKCIQTAEHRSGGIGAPFIHSTDAGI